MAMPQTMIEPRFPKWRSPLSGMPFNWQPPHGPCWSWFGVDRSCECC